MITDPEDVAKLFVLAWNDKDPEAIAPLFAEDAEFVNVTGLWWHNRQSILKAHRYGFDKNTEIIPGAETIIRDEKGKARGIDYRKN